MTWEVRESLLRLRRDATDRQMLDLEFLYGASVLRLGSEIIDQYLVEAQRRLSDFEAKQPRISGEN